MDTKPPDLNSVRSGFVRPILWLAITNALLSLANGANLQEAATQEKPVEFPLKNAIRGSEGLLKAPATVLIGEIHGTRETPTLVAALVRSAQTDRVPTILCVEISSSEQRSLNQFLQSDGSESARAALLSRPCWFGDDGRASVGMLAMIELLRRLNKQGGDVRLVAMDINLELHAVDPKSITPQELERLTAQVKGRDRAMADAVLAARKKYPESNVVVLAGNVHARLSKGLPGDPDYTPMGWHLAQALPNVRSLNIQFSSGDAWVATEKGVGPTRMKGVDRGNEPFIEVFSLPEDGYHGAFYVGKISAAPPVHKKVDRDESDQKK